MVTMPLGKYYADFLYLEAVSLIKTLFSDKIKVTYIMLKRRG